LKKYQNPPKRKHSNYRKTAGPESSSRKYNKYVDNQHHDHKIEYSFDKKLSKPKEITKRNSAPLQEKDTSLSMEKEKL
jgi:hypothetical protein